MTARHARHMTVSPLAGPARGRLTVVVLTFNRAAQLHRSLTALMAHNPGIPIVVVDNASSDGTSAMVRQQFPDITVIRCDDNFGAAGRNAGVAAVRTEFVAFCDDDTWWEDDSLRRAATLLDEHPDVAVLSPRVIVGDAGVTDATCEAMSVSSLQADGLPGPALIGYMASAAVFRTAAFRRVGGYTPRFFIGGEEELVALDLLARGWLISYAPGLTLRHCPSPLRDAARRRQLLIRNAVWVACMRLPLRAIAERVHRAVRAMIRERTLLRDGWDTIAGVPWALRRRQPLPDAVLAMLAQVRDDDRRRARQMRNRVH